MWNNIMLLAIANVLMLYGVGMDIKCRKFPNIVLLIIIMIGIIGATLQQHLYSSIVFFLLINGVGIYLHKLKILAAGDSKFLSVIPFFIDFSQGYAFVSFLIPMFVSMLLIGGLKLYKDMGSETLKEIKRQLMDIKIFILSNFTVSPQKGEYQGDALLQKTLPFTLQIYLAFLCSEVILFCLN